MRKEGHGATHGLPSLGLRPPASVGTPVFRGNCGLWLVGEGPPPTRRREPWRVTQAPSPESGEAEAEDRGDVWGVSQPLPRVHPRTSCAGPAAMDTFSASLWLLKT